MSQLEIGKIFGMILIEVSQYFILFNSIQSSQSVACHPELAILSRKLGITEHAQLSVAKYISFFQQYILEVLQVLHIYQIMVIRPNKTVTY